MLKVNVSFGFYNVCICCVMHFKFMPPGQIVNKEYYLSAKALCWNALMLTHFFIFKTVVKVGFRDGLQLSLRFSSFDSKRGSMNGLLSFVSSQKSNDSKSGENSGCGTIWVKFSVKWSRRINWVQDNALSWGINKEFSRQNSSHLWRIASQRTKHND